MNGFPLTGGCNCGAVRFEVTSPLLVASYCHCRRCQRRTGTAFSASVLTEPGSVTVTHGADQLRTYAPETGFHKQFCAHCGSQVFAVDRNDGSAKTPMNPERWPDSNRRPTVYEGPASSSSPTLRMTSAG